MEIYVVNHSSNKDRFFSLARSFMQSYCTTLCGETSVVVTEQGDELIFTLKNLNYFDEKNDLFEVMFSIIEDNDQNIYNISLFSDNGNWQHHVISDKIIKIDKNEYFLREAMYILCKAMTKSYICRVFNEKYYLQF